MRTRRSWPCPASRCTSRGWRSARSGPPRRPRLLARSIPHSEGDVPVGGQLPTTRLSRMADDGGGNAVEQTLSRLRRIDTRTEPAPAPGAPRTLSDLYQDHRMRMVRLAVLLVDDPSTAEDVVQEAFTGLHRHWSGLRDEAAAIGYLRTAVVNGSRSVLRRRRTA